MQQPPKPASIVFEILFPILNIVNKDYRKRKVATMLYKLLEKKIKGKAHVVWCDTRTNNVESMAFVKKQGFSKLSTLKNYWYNQDYYFWKKHLK